MEAQRLELDSAEFDPERIVYEICELVAPKLSFKDICLACRFGNRLPFHVVGDQMRFRQVLQNLIENALKFTSSGEIILFLDAEDSRDDAIKLHFSVKDTGIGIADVHIDSIFEPFQQADGSLTRKYGGTGLGLSICRQLAKQMEGDVWVESILNQGSTFHFTSWLKKARSTHTRSLFHPLLSGKTAVLLDNNAAHLEILSNNLEMSGVHPISTMEITEALADLKHASMHSDSMIFFIFNAKLPRLKIGALIHKVRKLSCPVHCIAFTSSVKPAAKYIRNTCVDYYLNMPVRRDKLIQCLTALVKSEQEHIENMNNAAPQFTCSRQPHILLAEDNSVNRKLLKIMLNKAGCLVDAASNGREAVDMFFRDCDSFDLILMDVHMPEMDGIAATRIIRQNGYLDIPIVALTASALAEDRRICSNAGMNDYIVKPITTDKIFYYLEKWIKKGSHLWTSQNAQIN
jgi:CheY-like chemotaxis protein